VTAAFRGRIDTRRTWRRTAVGVAGRGASSRNRASISAPRAPPRVRRSMSTDDESPSAQPAIAPPIAASGATWPTISQRGAAAEPAVGVGGPRTRPAPRPPAGLSTPSSAHPRTAVAAALTYHPPSPDDLLLPDLGKIVLLATKKIEDARLPRWEDRSCPASHHGIRLGRDAAQYDQASCGRMGWPRGADAF